MIELYARAQLPYPRDQAVLDFHVLSIAEGFSTVGLVIAKREMLQQNLAILNEAGLHPNSFTLSASGVFEWYRNVYPLSMQAQANSSEEDSQNPQDGYPRLIVNVDDSRTDLAVVTDDRILTSRSIGQGRNQWPTDAEAIELLAIEVERTLAAMQKELPHLSVQSFILTGIAPSTWQAPPGTEARCPG